MPIESRDEFFDQEVLEMFPEAFQTAEDVAGRAFEDGEDFTEEQQQRRRELIARKRRLQKVDFGEARGGRIWGNPFSVDYSPLTNAILSGAQSVINAERQKRLIGDPKKAEQLESKAAKKREEAQSMVKEKEVSGDTGPGGTDTVTKAPENMEKHIRLKREAKELEQQAEKERGVLLPLQELYRQRKQARQDEKAENQFTRQLFQQFSKAGIQQQQQEDQFEQQKELTEIQNQNQRDLARLQNTLKEDLVDYEQQAKQGTPPDLSEFRQTVNDVTSSQQNVIDRLENRKEDVQNALKWKNTPDAMKTSMRYGGEAPNVPQSLLEKDADDLRKEADSLQQEINKTGKRINRINKDIYKRAAAMYGIPVEKARQLFTGNQQGASGEDDDGFGQFNRRTKRRLRNIMKIINSGQQQSPDPGRQPAGTTGVESRYDPNAPTDTVYSDFTTDFN